MNHIYWHLALCDTSISWPHACLWLDLWCLELFTVFLFFVFFVFFQYIEFWGRGNMCMSHIGSKKRKSPCCSYSFLFLFCRRDGTTHTTGRYHKNLPFCVYAPQLHFNLQLEIFLHFRRTQTHLLSPRHLSLIQMNKRANCENNSKSVDIT